MAQIDIDMEFLTQHKLLSTLAAVAVLIAGIYFFYPSGGGGENLLVSSGAGDSQPAAIGRDFLSMLLDLRGIKLDDSVFDDAGFRSLKDFSVELTSQPTGRKNPFLPIE